MASTSEENNENFISKKLSLKRLLVWTQEPLQRIRFLETLVKLYKSRNKNIYKMIINIIFKKIFFFFSFSFLIFFFLLIIITIFYYDK